MNRGNKTAFITENMVYFTSAVKASEAIPGGKKKKDKMTQNNGRIAFEKDIKK